MHKLTVADLNKSGFSFIVTQSVKANANKNESANSVAPQPFIQPMTTKVVCERSLRWILALRQHAAVHKYDIRVIDKRFPEAVTPFGHSGGSFMWTVEQSKEIDRVGLDAWLGSPAARGYGASATSVMRAVMSSSHSLQ